VLNNGNIPARAFCGTSMVNGTRYTVSGPNEVKFRLKTDGSGAFAGYKFDYTIE